MTIFEGRTTDAAEYGKIWVEADIKGKKEPAEPNTGNYAGKDETGLAVPAGNPRSVTVDIKAGEYLFYAHMEDNSGGISGMIIRGIGDSTPVVSGPLTFARTTAGVAEFYHF